jgi:hypothetical protein
MKSLDLARASAASIRNFTIAIATCAVLAAIELNITACASTHRPAIAKHVGNPLLGEDWAQPLPGGVATTVAVAQSQAGFAVPMPNDPPAASQSNLTQTWVVGKAQQVALVFDQGKVDIEMWPWPAFYPDPATRFQQLVTSLSASAAIVQVNGQPALVIQPNTDYIKANRAWVEVDLNGIDINISSDSYGTDVLLQIADSLPMATSSPSPSSSSTSASNG